MKRPVKFNASRNPRAENAYKRRFYNVLLIEKVVTGGFIKRRIYAPTDFGQYFYFKIFVSKNNYGVFFADFILSVNPKHNLIRIGSAACALVHAVFRKHRHFFCRRFGISGYYELFNFAFYIVHKKFILYFLMN